MEGHIRDSLVWLINILGLETKQKVESHFIRMSFLPDHSPTQLAKDLIILACLALHICGVRLEDIIVLYLIVAIPIFLVIGIMLHVMVKPPSRHPERKDINIHKSTEFKFEPEPPEIKKRVVRFAESDDSEILNALFGVGKWTISPLRRRRAQSTAKKGLALMVNAFHGGKQRNKNRFQRSMHFTTAWTNGPKPQRNKTPATWGKFLTKRSLRNKAVNK